MAAEDRFDFYNSSFGIGGFREITGAHGDATEEFVAIQVITDGDLTATFTNGDSLTALSLTAGTIIYGRCTAVTFATGICLGYKVGR